LGYNFWGFWILHIDTHGAGGAAKIEIWRKDGAAIDTAGMGMHVMLYVMLL
jgi:hypothetical protein